MKGTTLQVESAKGLQTSLPQKVENASIVTNFTVDSSSMGWSTRIGFEKYRPDPTVAFAPFTNLSRIDSLFVYDQLPNGARTSILFESGGTLYLYYEGVPGPTSRVLRAISTGRTIPTVGEPSSMYTQVGEYVLVTNGYEAPLLVSPWPLGDAAEAADAMAYVSRPLLYTTAPTAPRIKPIATMGTLGYANATGNQLCLFWPSQGGGISFGGLRGLGYTYNPTDKPDKESLYGWSISFISENGSESPLSSIGSVSWELKQNVEGFRYVAAIELPVGPEGTAARRIYRTQEYSTNPLSLDSVNTYYVDTVKNNIDTIYFDSTRGNALGAQAPSSAERARLQSPKPRFSAIYKSCLFMDGGTYEPNSIFYSYPGLPEQWSASGYIRLMGTGGAITGLFSYYNVLLVFRENGIDVISGDFDERFTATNLTNQLACRSPNSIDSAPGLGILFLAQDGVYSLSGGFQGGSQIKIEKISDPIQSYFDRLTQDCTPRAVARYCPLTRDYHIYFAVDGNDRPNFGAVYHVEKKGWSTREGFPVGCIDRLYTGELIFGHAEGIGPKAPAAPTGLFIISPRRALGGFLNGNTYTFSSPPTSTYRSAWINFGSGTLEKQVQYVTLWMVTTGSVAISLKHYKDFIEVGLDEQQYYSQPPDAELQPVFDTAIIDTDQWQDGRLVPIRVAVHEMSCAWFAFEFTTTDDLLFIGFEIEYMIRGTRVIEGKRV